jgi:hypothetical protein
MEMNLKRAVITDQDLSKNPRIPVPHNYIKHKKNFSFHQFLFLLSHAPSFLVPVPPSHFLGQVGIYI